MIVIPTMNQQSFPPRGVSRILWDLQHKFQEISLPDLGFIAEKPLQSPSEMAVCLPHDGKSHHDHHLQLYLRTFCDQSPWDLGCIGDAIIRDESSRIHIKVPGQYEEMTGYDRGF